MYSMKLKLKLQLPHKTFSEATDNMDRLKYLIHSVKSQWHKHKNIWMMTDKSDKVGADYDVFNIIKNGK